MARSMARAYVELMRNIPVLLHVAFWYGLLLASNRGIFLLVERQAEKVGPEIFKEATAEIAKLRK